MEVLAKKLYKIMLDKNLKKTKVNLIFLCQLADLEFLSFTQLQKLQDIHILTASVISGRCAGTIKSMNTGSEIWSTVFRHRAGSRTIYTIMRTVNSAPVRK